MAEDRPAEEQKAPSERPMSAAGAKLKLECPFDLETVFTL